MVPTGKLQAERVRAPIPVLALLAGLVTLFAFGINFGESIVGRTAPARHDHDGRGIGDEDHAKGPGGLAVASQGYLLRPRNTRFIPGEYENFRFTIFSSSGQPVTDFVRRGDRQMTLVVVRRDLTGYQHLYPVMDHDGTWTVPLDLEERGCAHLLIQEGGQSLVGALEHRVYGRQVGPYCTQQAQPVFDGAGKGAFVPQDRASRRRDGVASMDSCDARQPSSHGP